MCVPLWSSKLYLLNIVYIFKRGPYQHLNVCHVEHQGDRQSQQLRHDYFIHNLSNRTNVHFNLSIRETKARIERIE